MSTNGVDGSSGEMCLGNVILTQTHHEHIACTSTPQARAHHERKHTTSTSTSTPRACLSTYKYAVNTSHPQPHQNHQYTITRTPFAHHGHENTTRTLQAHHAHEHDHITNTTLARVHHEHNHKHITSTPLTRSYHENTTGTQRTRAYNMAAGARDTYKIAYKRNYKK